MSFCYATGNLVSAVRFVVVPPRPLQDLMRPRSILWLLACSCALSAPASAKRIVFVGNSFTFGALSPVQQWGAASVTDLNGEGIGGVPALFKRFSDESGRHDQVALETAAGRSLQWHWTNRRGLLDRRWDVVVLQEYSTLDADRPGSPDNLVRYSAQFSRMFRARNPTVRVGLVATWSRPDLTYPPGQHWSGRPIERMALDVRRGDDLARRATPAIVRVHPVGEAFNCAIATGIADPNPYDGTEAGKIDLWAPDHYHASTAGYYLEALTIFAGVTGRDPRRLGPKESAAAELGIAPGLAERLQAVAYRMALGNGCRPKVNGRDSRTHLRIRAAH
jgi:hypothetical protein